MKSVKRVFLRPPVPGLLLRGTECRACGRPGAPEALPCPWCGERTPLSRETKRELISGLAVAAVCAVASRCGVGSMATPGFRPAVAVAAGHIGEIEEIVAVVDQRGIESGRVQVLDLARLIAQHDVEHLSLGGLLDGQGGLGSGLGPGCWLVGLHLAGADVERALIGRRLGSRLSHHDQFLLERRALKTVLIFHIDGLAVNSGHSTASHIVEKAYDIVNLYIHDVVMSYYCF